VSTVDGQSRLVLPPERFYWALLDASTLGQGIEHRTANVKRKQLGYLFENALPLPIDRIHATYMKLNPGKSDKQEYLACGMSLEQLEAVLAERAGQALMLIPSKTPDFIFDQTQGPVDLLALNLLHGQFEPAALRSLRRRWMAQAAALALICALFAVLALERRTADLRRRIDQVQAARLNVYKDVFGESMPHGRQPIELCMTAELRKLRQTRRLPVADAAGEDSLPILADVLSKWPAGIFMQTETMSITSSALTIRGNVPANPDVQRLADALQGLANWRVQQPQVNATPQGIQTTVQLVRAPERGP